MSFRAVGILVALCLSAGALWLFQEILEDLVFDGTGAVDVAILHAFRSPQNPALPLGPAWIAEFARDVTALGSISILLLVVLATVLFLAFAGKRRDAIRIVPAIAGGLALNLVVKAIVERPRPDLAPPGMPVYGTSFPSGHAMMAAVTYLTLAAIAGRALSGAPLKIYVMALAVLLTLLVGLSRVYLAVHWPSDVLGGWCLGAAWALFCWAVAEWQEGRTSRR